MRTDDANRGARNPAPPPAAVPPSAPATVATPGLRHSTGVLIAAGLVGLVLGAIAAFAVTGLVWTVRVELPPPPYPPPLSSAQNGCLYPAPPAPGNAPAPAPGVIPAPPLPPAPPAGGPPAPLPPRS